MGVLGLWRLVDATGKPVPLETLEGKVLAIDVSIWIHQVIQGYQDRRGNSLPNAHLIGLFNRICKLMYFKIKPVFVFDGGVPLLKKNTIATRRKLKSIAASKAQKLKNDLINNLIKHTAVKGVLDKGKDEGESSATQQFKDSAAIAGSSQIHDMFKLPNMLSTSKLVNSDDDDYMDSDDQSELSPRKQSKWMGNIHSVDVNNEEFKNLPADVRYDILTDLKETRKQNSWGRIHELPAGSNNYSGFQVKRLLKRRYVQESLEEAEKEMGGKTLTLDELDKLLTDQGINTTQQQDAAFRIASDSKTRVIYVKNKPTTQTSENSNDSSKSTKSHSSKKMENDSNLNDDPLTDSLSVNSDTSVAIIENMQAYGIDEDWFSDEGFNDNTLNESELLPEYDIPKSVMNPALSYMLEHSGLTREQILEIVEQNKKNKKKSSDGGSSRGSSKRDRTPRRLSLNNKVKRKNLFHTTVVETPKIKKEVVDDSETPTIIESYSDSDDFVEVPEKTSDESKPIKNYNNPEKPITIESTDSGSDDFVEIQDVFIPEMIDTKKAKHDGIQIAFKVNEDLQDDIFADVFSSFGTIKKEDISIKNKPDTSMENKPELDEIPDRLSFKNIFPKESIKPDEYNEVKEVEKSSQEKESNKDQPVLSNSEESQLEFSNMCLPTTPQKSSQNVKVNDSLLVPENSTEKIIPKELITRTDEEKDKIETINDLDDIIDKDLLIDNSVNSENSSTAVNTQESIPSRNEEEQNKVQEIQKEPPLVLPVDETELESMKKQLETEQQLIAGSLGKLERQATDITDQMRVEAQELLRLFGVPYIVAPMEAEAQCAYLEQIKLTNGTITDDSDIWLFGGHCVYKNFFDNNKRVLQFLSSDIEHHFKLSRKEMIQLALLVGSDYTNGLAGVGPVTALEILAAFPAEGEDTLRGLRGFSNWFRAGKLSAPGKITLRNKLKNVQIEKGFPSQAVVQAYMCPMVDESKDAFTWGKPNLVLLADYVKTKFGWTKLKFEEIITPVMKKLAETKSQKGISSYFKVYTVPKSIEANLSKRVQTAVQKLSGSQPTEASDDETPTIANKEKVKKVKKPAAKKRKKSKGESSSELPTVPEVNEDESNVQAIEEAASQKIDETSIKNKPRKLLINLEDEVIPQREKDKANALNTKLRAIEVFRKSKKGPGRVRKAKKVVKKVKDEVELSESSSD